MAQTDRQTSRKTDGQTDKEDRERTHDKLHNLLAEMIIGEFERFLWAVFFFSSKHLFSSLS